MMDVELAGMQYILPLGANTPPNLPVMPTAENVLVTFVCTASYESTNANVSSMSVVS